MNDPGPYLRPQLLATRSGLTDPALLVERWFADYLELADLPSPSPEQAALLLALHARLLRCRPSLLAAHSSHLEDPLPLRDRLPNLLARALPVPDPDRWLLQADLLASACDEGRDHDSLRLQADLLLADLDATDLVAWTARHLGSADPPLEDALIPCHDWLSENCDRFFPSAISIQSVGQTLRPDLTAFDLDLAVTAEKFVLLLDALEDMQEQMGSSRPPLALAAATWAGFPDSQLAHRLRRVWLSPDRRREAELVVEPPDPAAPQVRVLFLLDSRLDPSLAGQPVWLAGCSAVITSQGHADFPRQALLDARAAGECLCLLIGDERQPWRPV